MQVSHKEFGDVQVAWLMQCKQRMQGRFEDYRPPKRKAPEEPKQEPKRKRIRRTDDQESHQITQQRSTCGGAWRAYVRARTWSCGVQAPFKEMMPEISRDYHNLPAHERSKMKSTGAAATLAGREKPNRLKSSFGLRGRDVARQTAAAYQTSLVNLADSLGDEHEDPADALDLQQTGGSLVSSMQAAQGLQRLRACATAATTREDAQEMERYAEGRGATALGEFMARFPDLEIEARAVPTDVGDAVIVQSSPPADEDMVGKLLATLGLHGGGSNALNGALDRAFRDLNAPVMEADCDHVNSQKPECRWCREAGRCLCTVGGKQDYAFKWWFHHTVTKPIGPPTSQDRMDLKHGFHCCVYERLGG